MENWRRNLSGERREEEFEPESESVREKYESEEWMKRSEMKQNPFSYFLAIYLFIEPKDSSPTSKNR